MARRTLRRDSPSSSLTNMHMHMHMHMHTRLLHRLGLPCAKRAKTAPWCAPRGPTSLTCVLLLLRCMSGPGW